jgi:hypothetical protein
MLRRLTSAEFTASIRSIFNDQSQAVPVAGVFSDPQVLGFSVDANALLIQGLHASQLMDGAEAVAAWAAAGNRLSQFGSCSTRDTACAQKFVKAFGGKAFRTKLADSDPRVAAYTTLFLAESTYSDGAQAVIAAMLQSPHFLYRSELGTAGGAGGAEFTLTPYEIASNLSYLLTGNMPDTELMAAADSVAAGSLTAAAMIDQQAQRLLTASDPRSQFAVMGFMNGWLGLDRLYTTAKDDTVFTLTKALQDDMASETRNLIMEAFNGNGGMRELLTANHSFLNASLAQFYGLSTAGMGTQFVSVPFTASTLRDGGLLAHATFHIGYSRPDTSSPTQRGHMVRTRMLCQEVPPPPPGLDTEFKPIAAQTTRERFEKGHSTGICYECHKLMDDIGYGFEHYDGFGRYRDNENGVAIDARGKLVNVNTREGSPPFDGLSGPGSLQEYLAASEDVKHCMVRHWAYYAYGSASWGQDACTYRSIEQEATANNYALRSVLSGIIHAAHFTRRVQDR